MSSAISLPDYRKPPAEVAARFERVKQRPVILDVKSLGKVYHGDNGDVVALRDIDLRIHQREFIALLGSSGCGKTTFFRIVAGFDTQTSGSILLDGHGIRGPGPDRGMVFQHYTLFPWLTVKKNVMFGLRMSGMSRKQAQSEALQGLEMVGLAAFADSYPHQLSGGMKQRVAIARALANDPRILLMDEPFGALDTQTRAQMQNYLMQIWKSVDVTILFITHDLDEAILLADRLIVLGSRPGHIKEIIEVPVSRPRSIDQELDPYFLATKKRVEELIHPAKQHAGSEKLPILSMKSAVGDVE
jgi:NitT/TauT family transport system ATP-binding protein